MAILSVGAIGYINGTGVRVRQTPVNGSVLYTATINDELQCQATQYGSDGYTWLRVLNTTDNTKATGWVREDLVRAGGYNGGNTGTAADGVIDGSGVRVRTGPGTSYGTLTFVSTNDRVTYYVGSEVYANGYTWVRCTSALWLSNGYIASEYVKPYTGGGTNPGGGIGGEANPPPNMPYINANMVPVKAHSSSSSTTLAYLNQNAPVVVTSSIGSWYGIFYNEGATPLNGFVQSTYLSFPVSGFPQTTGNYHCAACSYQGKLGKTLKRLSYYQYNTCSRHSNCKVVIRNILLSAYCPWCGDNHEDFDSRGTRITHIDKTGNWILEQSNDFDVNFSPSNEFTADERLAASSALNDEYTAFAEVDLDCETF